LLPLQLLGWVGSALLVYSVLQMPHLASAAPQRRRVGSIDNLQRRDRRVADVVMNLVLTAINAFNVVRLLRRRHDVETFEVIKVSPEEDYLNTC
jgi:hypothetical protein